MPYALLADLVTAVHLAIVLFTVAGLVLVYVGGFLGWRWVRSPLLRFTHLGVTAYIALNAIRDELCFLTHWEADLRRAAGQYREEDWSFVGRLLHDILFVEADQDLLHRIYLAFAGLVVLSFVLIPPRRRQDRSTHPV